MDGRLDEEAWGQVQHISNFTQRELDYGSSVTERTEVAILYDADALYVGFWGFDSEPQRILAWSWPEPYFRRRGQDRFGPQVLQPAGRKVGLAVKPRSDHGADKTGMEDGVLEAQSKKKGGGGLAGHQHDVQCGSGRVHLKSTGTSRKE
jgi:hypothetical protein